MRRGVSSSYPSIVCCAFWLDMTARNLDELVAMASSCRRAPETLQQLFSCVERRGFLSSSPATLSVDLRMGEFAESLGLGTVQAQILQLRSSTLLPCLFFPSAALKVLEQLNSRVERDFLPYALHSRSTRFSAILKLQRSHLDARRSPSCIARSAGPRTSSLCLVRGRVPKVLEQLTGYIEHLLMENIASYLSLCTPLYVAIGRPSR
ncbi:hypothetical protein EV714DRAFT_278270 [Schizophyllum commune]